MRASVLLLLSLAAPAAAQDFDAPSFALPGKKVNSFDDIATMRAVIEPGAAKPGQVVTFKLTVEPAPGSWTYPGGPNVKQLSRNTIALPTGGDLIFVAPVTDPPGAKAELDGEEHYTKAVTWTFPAVVSPKATPGKKTVTLTETSIQACNASKCLPAPKPPAAEFEVLGGPPEVVPPQYAALVDQQLRPKAPEAVPAGPTAPPPAPESATAGLVTKTAVPLDKHVADLEQLRGNLVKDTDAVPANGLWGFLLTAAAWGYISLATPCVFPMIPITVSLFLKQGHQSPRQVLRLAAVYCLTIIAVLGVSAWTLLSLFQQLSVNPWMNIFLGGLFVFFALSLFGMYDITLPGFLLRFTERRRGAGGLLGIVFGALAFSIVSFTCVAPFLGGFAGMAASGQFTTVELALGGVAFSTAFASPFLVLALFPSLLKKMPRSGGWLDTVKAVMGFLELAAAIKFLRTAELGLLGKPEYLTYDAALAGMVVVAAACGLYLLNLYRLPHDEERPTIGVPRLMFALAFLGVGLHLLPGLFKGPDGQPQRPAGVVYAWVDAFLLPEPAEGGGGHLPWASDLPAAVERARREPPTSDRRFVFVDFTGETCSNCKLNEKNIFPRPEVSALLKRYTLVSMYTDWVPTAYYRGVPPPLADRKAEAEKGNLVFQEAAFGTLQRPLYVILEPRADGKVRVVDVYDEGKINDPARFAAFLAKPLGGVK